MSRYYRRRRNSSADGGVGFLVLIGAAFVYTKFNDFADDKPYLLPLLLVVLVAVVTLAIGFKIHQWIRSRQIERAFTIADIDAMDGVKFEYYLAKLLTRRGYKNVRVTEKYDLGVDIVAQKDGVTWGIQAKRHNSHVKAAAVRQVYTALTRYKCDRSMVITNNTFSRPARELANDVRCVLVGRDELAQWVYETSKK